MLKYIYICKISYFFLPSYQEFLHSKNFLHGNIRARSVLVTKEFTAKLWGLHGVYMRKNQGTNQREDPSVKKWQAPEVLAKRVPGQSSDMWVFPSASCTPTFFSAPLLTWTQFLIFCPCSSSLVLPAGPLAFYCLKWQQWVCFSLFRISFFQSKESTPCFCSFLKWSPSLPRGSSICRNPREWALAVSSTGEKPEKTSQLLQRTVCISGVHWSLSYFSLPPISKKSSDTFSPLLSSDTPLSRLAASGRIRIDRLWRRWAASWRQQRKVPQTKSSRCRRQWTSSSTCRRLGTAKPTATRSSDGATPVHSRLHYSLPNGAL